MAGSLEKQTRALRDATTELVKLYQFRDRSETVAYGVSVSQAYALSSLARLGALTMGSLAADLHLTQSTLSRVVEQLVQKGFVRRSQDPEDRRVWRIDLTDRGRRLWRRLEDELLAIDREVLESIAPSEREALIRAMRLLARSTERWRASRQ